MTGTALGTIGALAGGGWGIAHSIEKVEPNYKQAEEFYHRTSNLDPILQSGKIMSLRHIAAADPKKEISVETERWERERKKLPAVEAYGVMKEKKDVDHIFLTKDAPIGDESYGKYIIKKETKRPFFAKNLNMIPSEYKQKQPISVKRTTEIFAPADEIPQLQQKYPSHKFRDISDIKNYHPGYSVGSFINKVLANAGVKVAEDIAQMKLYKLKKELGHPARPGGSAALGINVPGSDVDIFLPYKKKHHFEKAKERLMQKHPELTPSPYNKPGGDKFVLTSPQADVVLAFGHNATKRVRSEERAKKILTPEKRSQIVAEKTKLKNAWFFKEYRYKKYKRALDKQLGLHKW
jgi:hypothetical protein